MPIPIILAGLAGGAIGAGVGAAIVGANDNKLAESLARMARDSYEDSQRKLDRNKERCLQALESLGHLKSDIWKSQIDRAGSLFSRADFSIVVDVSGRNELDRSELQDMARGVENARRLSHPHYSNTSTTASSVVRGIGAGVLVSTSTAGIATIAAGTRGVATLVSSLGAGSTVAGACLLLVAPATLMFGLIESSKARENLANANRYRAEVEVEVAKIETVISIINGIAETAEQCHETLEKLSARTTPILDDLETVITKNRTSASFFSLFTRGSAGRVDYERLSWNDRRTVYLAVTFVRALKALLVVPLLTKQGEPDKRSHQKPIQDAHRLMTRQFVPANADRRPYRQGAGGSSRSSGEGSEG